MICQAYIFDRIKAFNNWDVIDFSHSAKGVNSIKLTSVHKIVSRTTVAYLEGFCEMDCNLHVER